MTDIERLRARIAELESQQSEDIMIGRRRVRPAGVIQNGRYYIIPRRSNGLVIVGWVIVAAFVVFVLAPLLIAPPQALMSVPTLGTADVRTRPTPPQNDSAPAPVSVPLFADATPEPAYDNAAYNATAQASQQEPSAEPVPVGDVYIIEATPTALPQPGQEGFSESFAEPVCSPMIDYLRGHPCYGRVGQKALPQPGDSDFAASFEEPGD